MKTKWKKPFSTSEIGQRLNSLDNDGEELDPNYYRESELDNYTQTGWFKRMSDLTQREDHNLENIKERVEEDRKVEARHKAIENAIQERRRKGNLWNLTWEEQKGGA